MQRIRFAFVGAYCNTPLLHPTDAIPANGARRDPSEKEERFRMPKHRAQTSLSAFGIAIGDQGRNDKLENRSIRVIISCFLCLFL
jgi:hypothetical protein